MKFSIIIPVYKVENYLNQCIDSVISQSYKDYELVLVDDGSPDGCPKICDEYAEKYSFVKVIHQQNGGLSDARNTGIDNANGQYLIFVDSDDFIVNGCLQKIADALDKFPSADILIVKMCDFNDGDGNVEFSDCSFEPFAIEDNEKYVKNGLTDSSLVWAAFCVICSRSFVDSNSLKFKKGFIGAEDLDFYLNALRCNPKMVVSDITMAAYRQNRVGSITTENKYSAVAGRLIIFKEHFDYYFNSEKTDFNKFMTQFISGLACVYSLKCHNMNKQDAKRVIELIKSCEYMIKYSTKSQDKLFCMIAKFVGYRNAAKLAMTIIKLKNSLKVKCGG